MLTLNFLKSNIRVNIYVLAGFLSSIGNRIYMFILPWLVYEITGSSVWMGFLFLLQMLPSLLVSPIVGSIVDKYNRKVIIFVSNLILLLVMCILTILLLVDVLNILLLGIITVFLSITTSFSFISEESILPQIVKKDDLVKVNTLYQFLNTVALLSGPSLGGLIVSVYNSAVALFIGALTFIPVLVSVFFLNINYYKGLKSKSSGLLKDTVVGIKYIVKTKILLLIVLLSFVMNIANGAVDAMFVFFARDNLNIGPFHLGLIFTMSSIAQIVCGLLAPLLAGKFKHFIILIVSSGISSIAIMFMSIVKSWIFIGLFRGLQEGPTITGNILNKTLRQSIVPNNILGRVNAVNGSLSVVSYPLSGFLAGIVTEVWSIRLVFQSVAILLFMASLISFMVYKKHGKGLNYTDANIS